MRELRSLQAQLLIMRHQNLRTETHADTEPRFNERLRLEMKHVRKDCYTVCQ